MAAEPQTPEWWLRELYRRLVHRRRHVSLAWDYYEGRHRLAFASEKFLEAFGGLFQAFADNWCELVVDAVDERLNVEGFKFADELEHDRTAWDIWQRNQLDADSQLGHLEALVSGEGYATCWVDDADQADITIEPASLAIVATDPRHRRRRLAGLRTYVDDAGVEHAELFLPDRVWLFRSPGARRGATVSPERADWQPDITNYPNATEDGKGAWIPNPLGVVPMVALSNRPRLVRWSHQDTVAWSELASIIPIQDACNLVLADMLVAAEYTALPQRVAIGMEIPEDDDGNPTNPFTANLRTWIVEATETGELPKFEQFQAGDLSSYVKAVELLVQHVASISRTPPHYLNASADRLSGESIKAAETGLVAKARRRQRTYGEAWEEIIRLALQIEDVAGAGDRRIETLWADPESRTETEHIDAVLKRKALDVPTRQLWEDAGYSPTDIERMERMAATARFRSDLLADDRPAPGPAEVEDDA